MTTNHASFTAKKHQDTHGHTFTTQFTELCIDLEIFYQIILFITMKLNGVKKHAIFLTS